MALFDNINSRYTKSMEHGGSYERDAAIGGYDRKELRGLSKQARRGTLTQRERARYKYLKDERGGRRKRGLLAGLGGVGATLGALAAAGKLGKGEGGGGAALMEAIKARIDDKRKARADELGEKGEGSMESISSLTPSDRFSKPVQDHLEDLYSSDGSELMESGPGIGKSPVSSNMQQPSDLELMGLSGSLPEGSRKVSQDASRTQEVSKLRDFLNKKSTPLSDDQVRKLRSEGEAHTQSVVEELRKKNALDEAFEEMRKQEAQRSAPMVEDFKQVGNEARGTDPRTDEERDEEGDELMKYLDFKGRLTQDPHLQRLLRYGRFNKGGKVSASDSDVNDLLKRLNNMGRTDEDPLKKAASQSLSDLSGIQKRVLTDFNKMRAEHGLNPVNELTEENVSEMEALKSGMSKGGSIKNSLRNSMNNRYR